MGSEDVYLCVSFQKAFPLGLTSEFLWSWEQFLLMP